MKSGFHQPRPLAAPDAPHPDRVGLPTHEPERRAPSRRVSETVETRRGGARRSDLVVNGFDARPAWKVEAIHALSLGARTAESARTLTLERADSAVRAPAVGSVAASTNIQGNDFQFSFGHFRAGLFLAGLLFVGVLSSLAATTNPPPAWPPPPAEPRVVYVRAIASPSDIGVKPSALNRVAD